MNIPLKSINHSKFMGFKKGFCWFKSSNQQIDLFSAKIIKKPCTENLPQLDFVNTKIKKGEDEQFLLWLLSN